MHDLRKRAYPILLAGGSGTRLWPVSRALYPKQLAKFIGDDSLVQSTIKRLTPLLDLQNVRVVCGAQHYHEIARHMDDIGVNSKGKIIQEPSGRNTAPAILLAAFHIGRLAPQALMCIFPADHVIGKVASFHEKLDSALRLADQGYLVTFGIKPNYPETGYGYIESGKDVGDGARWVRRFVEKPDRPTAEKYIAAGNFFWNSGMFAFRVDVILEEFKKHQPALMATMEDIFSLGKPPAEKDYDRLESVSIDYAIMEKTDKCVVVPSDFGWSDIGSWKSLYDFLEKDANRNVIDGDVIAQNTRNCFILGHERLIATNRLRNLVVVETPDSLFVSDLDHSRDVKAIVTELKDRGRKEYRQHRSVYHPWGIAKLLEQRDAYTAAELTVYPGATCRLAADAGTTNHFIVINGQAKVSCGSRKKTLGSRDAVTLRRKGPVEIENQGGGELCLIQLELRQAPES